MRAFMAAAAFGIIASSCGAMPGSSGPDGQYDPIPYFAGRQVGDRSLILYDLTGGTIRSLPHEVWVTDAEGERGSALVRISKAGPGYYGWYPGPSEWDWSE